MVIGYVQRAKRSTRKKIRDLVTWKENLQKVIDDQMDSNHHRFQSKIALGGAGNRTQIETDLREVPSQVFHNVTCYHYTTPPFGPNGPPLQFVPKSALFWFMKVVRLLEPTPEASIRQEVC